MSNLWKTPPNLEATQSPQTETALWGTKVGSPDHYEELLMVKGLIPYSHY